ncbi:MAG: tRNA pseudouridine(38-40) synthase TruA [Actinomycetota bacterium]
MAEPARIVRLSIAYDGTDFRGWARQRGSVRTVQGELEQALARVLPAPVSLSVAGRTDAGVHASGQVASFQPPGDADLDLTDLRRRCNAQVSPEIVVREATWAPAGFDARFSATAREYRYRIDISDAPDPFSARTTWHRRGDLSLRRMRMAARYLEGEHDFASFCRTPQAGGSSVREVERVSVSRQGAVVQIFVRANAFCHQMVRALAGTLVGVGAGRLEPDAIPAILAARDRSAAPQIAPPHGLTLERVVFGRR